MDNIVTLSDTFEQIFDELKQEYDCTYLFYCYEDNNGKIVRSSNPDWYKLYFEEGLIEHCPLVRMGLTKMHQHDINGSIMVWDNVQSYTDQEENVVGIRGEFNLHHGISFGREAPYFKEFLGLATDDTNHYFPTLIMMNKSTLDSYLCRLRKAVNIEQAGNVIIFPSNTKE
ncbi:autoinducer binding domain-containing protein [Shewanella sp. 202IG2-18]|uniref:autoinducer binding domain-containing protein n=1 Tax=Parashewanella hymeniacidonis TaxID=2807618 RepID=UPI00195FB5F4|nr:autoinducer binding domain-containing protein [Parashewanella hymeniacidonis]MBM7073005.1 autoinducer binding domain-containing protein [Parashewanella hymeniacidonis]